MPTKKVIVVGAGPGGLTSATILCLKIRVEKFGSDIHNINIWLSVHTTKPKLAFSRNV